MSAPTGLKRTSSPLQISAQITETAPNVFTDLEIPLTLNVLDNEVFVVTMINLDVDSPDLTAVLGRNHVTSTLSSTAMTSVGSIANSNVIGAANRALEQMDVAGLPFVTFWDREDPLFAAVSEDYLGIIATNNMFLNIQGGGNLIAKKVRVRVYGYRASASSSVYAALVQSELLSA